MPCSSGGRTFWNLTSSKMSYAPFTKPEISEPAAQAKVLGTAVMLAAAGRSSGATTAMTYEARVGTSICDRALRARSRAIAMVRSGAKGIRINRTFDGRWVKTIVLINPMIGDRHRNKIGNGRADAAP